jgi:hypothetical protein
MWKSIPNDTCVDECVNECVDKCVLLSDECENHCPVFILEKDCVEKHCVWDGIECRRNCDEIVSENDCEADTSCFWLKKNENVLDEECVGKV